MDCFIVILYFFIVIINIFDVNYFVRTYFTVLSGRIYQKTISLNEVTTIYGFCSFHDCDIRFQNLRLARILREIDFARYHFYDRTGIYRKSRSLKIKSLQGCTHTICMDPVNLLAFYKINTKLVYWDERSLFLEHELATISDNKIRYSIISRQHAIGENGESCEYLLESLPGFNKKPNCPDYIKIWLHSMNITSIKLNNKKRDSNIHCIHSEY
ncbi:protein THEM6-like isoform X2 [Achroia grisella]|uniref:protein THEM6-like isoform X2 n=1 Tax=Achroia grisella TaxID=688607 RepID=UPI0027D311E5|nr:protein THEM6-like isoform X2 [Achroia grisella]